MDSREAKIISHFGPIFKAIRKAAEKRDTNCFCDYITPEDIDTLRRLGYKVDTDSWDHKAWRGRYEISW